MLQSVQRLPTVTQLTDEVMDLLDAAVDNTLGGPTLPIGLPSRLGRTLSAHGDFVRSGGHLIDGGGYLIGLVALARHCDFGSTRLLCHRGHQTGQLGGSAGYLRDKAVDLFDETVERGRQFAQFIAAGDWQAVSQVAVACSHVVKIMLEQ